MVLLTSSAISAAISGAVVCVFTFLLFLSGYVLQQQTVRSLQHAIKNPPEKTRYGPVPTLPAQFQVQSNDNESSPGLAEVILDPNISILSDPQSILRAGSVEVDRDSTPSLADNEAIRPEDLSLQRLWLQYLQLPFEQELNMGESPITEPSSALSSLAFMFAISSPSELCSAALFAKSQNSETQLGPRVSIVYIYPATWEISDSPIHTSAMDLIREMQDKYGVICHPVSISRVWAGVDLKTQLLSEITRTRWEYDRALYLKSPGVVIDVATLEGTLAASETQPLWEQVTTSKALADPDVLLYANGEGLMAPKGKLSSLVWPVQVRNAEGRNATYLTFDRERQVEADRGIRGSSDTVILDRYERERAVVCAGTSLLSEVDGVD